jgi:hypothetical protein
MAIAPLFIVPSVVHAQSGQVCLATSGSTGCPASPPVFVALQGNNLSIAVNVQGSDAMNGFDIQILTDPTVLNPVGVSLTGSILPSLTTSVNLECLNGIIVTGNACTVQDAPGVLHFSATTTGTPLAAPATGLLFTAIFNVLVTTGSSPVGFNTGCANTSVSGVCVTISNGTGTPVGETAQSGASFGNEVVYTMTSTPAKIQTPLSTVATSTITLASLGGFNDFVDLTVTASAGLTASVTSNGCSPTTAGATACVVVPFGGNVNSTLSVSSATKGNYTVTISGFGETTTVANSVMVPVEVTPADFSLSAFPTSVNIAPGNSGTTAITVHSISGFTGTVSLTTSTSSSSLTATISAGSVATPGTATLTVSSSVVGSYTATVTGMSGSLTHSVTVPVTVLSPDFSVFANPNSLLIPTSAVGTSSVVVKSLNNFAGTISLAVTAVPTGDHTTVYYGLNGNTTLPFHISQTSLTVTAGGVSQTTLAFPTVYGDANGNYTVTITGTSGSIVHTAVLNVTLGDFDFFLCPISTPVCSTTTTSIVGPDVLSFDAHALGGATSYFELGTTISCTFYNAPYFGGASVCLLPVYYPNGTLVPLSVESTTGPLVMAQPHFRGLPGVFENPDQLCITFGLPANSPGCGDDATGIYFYVLPGTTPGTYSVQVTGTGLPISHTQTLTMIVPQPPDFLAVFWTHHVSISRNHGTQTFASIIVNFDFKATIYAEVVITGIGSRGDTFTLTSPVLTIKPFSFSINHTLSITFNSSYIGEVYTFTSEILYSGDPAIFTLSLGHFSTHVPTIAISNVHLFPTSGSFKIVP